MKRLTLLESTTDVGPVGGQSRIRGGTMNFVRSAGGRPGVGRTSRLCKLSVPDLAMH